MDGLTDIRTASDFLSSSKRSDNSSDFFEADSDQDLHSLKQEKMEKIRSFIREISKELDSDSEDEIEQPKIRAAVPLDPEELKNYDLKKADAKQRKLAYIAQFLTEDIGFTIKDVEKVLDENKKKVHKVSE